jgi:hypothetical protein
MKKLFRFRDLTERNIVNNWMTLGRWIEKEGFPPGIQLGPNSRAWTEESIEEWLASRQRAPLPAPPTPAPKAP